MWANAHETWDSISLVSYAGCLALSPVISAKIRKMCTEAWNRKKTWKPPILDFKVVLVLVPPESSSALPVMISSKSVSICNRSYARQANSGKITTPYNAPSPRCCPEAKSFGPPFLTPITADLCEGWRRFRRVHRVKMKTPELDN